MILHFYVVKEHDCHVIQVAQRNSAKVKPISAGLLLKPFVDQSRTKIFAHCP